MTRIFIQNDIGDKEYFTLDREDSHYLISVLRMRPGEELIIVDGPGKENLAQIDNANKEGVTVRITERRKDSSLPVCVQRGEDGSDHPEISGIRRYKDSPGILRKMRRKAFQRRQKDRQMAEDRPGGGKTVGKGICPGSYRTHVLQ